MRTREAAERAIEANNESRGIAFDGVKLKVEMSMRVCDTAGLKRAGARCVQIRASHQAVEEEDASGTDIDAAFTAAAQLEVCREDKSDESSAHQVDSWLEYIDEGTGDSYYHNTETGKTVCERPGSMAMAHGDNSTKTSDPVPGLKGGGGYCSDNQSVIFVKNLKVRM